MKRMICSSSSISNLSRMLLQAYIRDCSNEYDWTEEDMKDQSDPFYANENSYRSELAEFIAEHFDAHQITSLKFTMDDDTGDLFELFYGDDLAGTVQFWYSQGRYDFEVVE